VSRHNWRVGRVLALGVGLWWASAAASAELSPRQAERVCQEDCVSAREKCSEVCGTHAGKGLNVCLKACGQMEQECRSDCRAPRSVTDDK
jgi:hypothetical protein